MSYKVRQDQISDKTVISRHLSRLLDILTKRPGWTDRVDFSGVLSSEYLYDRQGLIEAISKDLKSGDYKLGIARRKLLKIDKWRVVYEFDFIDRVVMSVIGEQLNLVSARFMPPQVHSFIRGRSNLTAIKSVARALRHHFNSARRPIERELLVWRFDIKSYTDSIPLGVNSKLWTTAEQFIFRYFENPRWIYEIFRQGLNPVIIDHPNFEMLASVAGFGGQIPNGPVMNLIGTTTGTAFAPIAANIYLRDFDRFMCQKKGFYARYGDDILFAHNPGHEAETSICEARFMISRLGLTPNLSKEKIILLTGRGPLPNYHQNEFIDGIPVKPCQHFDFLGWQINHRGDCQPKVDKLDRELRQIKRRINNVGVYFTSRDSFSALENSSSQRKYLLRLVEMISFLRIKNSRSDLSFTNRKSMEKLSPAVQKSLDREIARSLSSNITGIRGAKTFRYLSWAFLINEFGLKNSQRYFTKRKKKPRSS
jgi:hypothetical protein